MQSCLSELRQGLDLVYSQVEHAAQHAVTLQPPDGLPVELIGPGDIRLLPASSLAVQSLVARGTLHTSLIRLRRDMQEWLPAVEGSTFWQPPDTFHLNVAILDRLHRGASADYTSLLTKGAEVLEWLAGCPAYTVEFRGALITREGTILAKGYPLSPTPWQIRERFVASGFADQQKTFHITVGRILRPLPSPIWGEVRDAIAGRLSSTALGMLHVHEAMLIAEREGFLHSSDCYRRLRSYSFSP